MLPPVCFTCSKLFADIEIPLKEKFKTIMNNDKLSNEQKSAEKEKFLDDEGYDLYCCRSKLISFINMIDIIV